MSDVFISYAHLDNQALPPFEGWVDKFEQALKLRLGELRGNAPAVWRDPQLSPSALLTPEIQQQVRDAALLLTVLSPRWVDSPSCRKELDEFLLTAVGNLSVNNKSRILKVEKTAVPRSLHPDVMKDLLGHVFYESDQQGREREIRWELDAKKFWTKVDDVAQDIRDTLTALHNQSQLSSPELPAVFLAEATSDVAEARDNLMRELRQRGYPLFPNRSLPLSGEDVTTVVNEALNECRIAVHLIGSKFAAVPEAERRSIAMIEQELAGAHATRRADFRQIVWIPRGITINDSRQRDFVEALRESVPSDRSELIESTLEEMKTVLFTRLKEAGKAEQQLPVGATARCVYLVYDRQDVECANACRDALFDAGLDVLVPAFDGDEAQIRLDHEQNLLPAMRL